MTSYLKMETVPEKAMFVVWVLETKSLIKRQRRYRTQHGKDSPSDNAGQRYSNRMRLAVSCTKKEREVGAPRREMLIESRERFLEAYRNQLH
jgi:hypothetical protein